MFSFEKLNSPNFYFLMLVRIYVNILMSLFKRNQFSMSQKYLSRKTFDVFIILHGFLLRKVKWEWLTLPENRAWRRARRKHGNWCPLSTSLPVGRGKGVVRARGLCARLNWLGTVLDSPDYSYRAAMPRARAPFPHSSDDPVSTPPSPLFVLFLFRLIRTHTCARTAHTRLTSRSLYAQGCVFMKIMVSARNIYIFHEFSERFVTF